MSDSVPVFDSGANIATASGNAGTQADPKQPKISFGATTSDSCFPLFGTGAFFATASGSGTPSDPFVPLVASSGSVDSSFPLFGTGCYFATVSGQGTPDDPFVPLVSVVATVNFAELESGLGVIELEGAIGNMQLES